MNSFSFALEEARENLGLEILGVLRKIGEDESSVDVVTAASIDFTLGDSSP